MSIRPGSVRSRPLLTLNFMVKGEVVWSYQSQTSAPHFVQMKQGESVGQTAQKGADPDSTAFDNIWIPVTIAKPPASVEPIAAAYPAC